MTWREKLIARILFTVARMLATGVDGGSELRNELRRLSVDLEAVTIPENVFGGVDDRKAREKLEVVE